MNAFVAVSALRRVTVWTVGVALLLPTLVAGTLPAYAQGDAARLDGIIVDGNRLAVAGETGLVIVIRNGVREEAYAGVTLQPGDRIETGPRANAVLRFTSGTELLMQPSSGGRIGSLSDFVGEVFVKAEGVFSVETSFVKADARGTEYLVRTHEGGATSVVVIAGIVEVASTTGAWPPVSLSAGMTALAHPRPPHPAPANADVLAATLDWVERVERMVPAPSMGSSVGALLGALLGNRALGTIGAFAGAAAAPAKRRCASAALPPFPWPSPPQPSSIAIVPPYLLFGTEGKATTLAAVAARLEGAIARAGYQQPKYLGAGCDGFAIVLDLEHIDADGTRLRGTVGFAPPSQDEPFSLATYVKRLFYAPPGQYRQIVLVVSDQRMAQATASPTETELRAIARDGVSALPAGFSIVPYTTGHVVQALIYEFEKGPRDGDAKWVPPEGRLGATVHLMKAQLF